jgi:hypothetical protein
MPKSPCRAYQSTMPPFPTYNARQQQPQMIRTTDGLHFIILAHGVVKYELLTWSPPESNPPPANVCWVHIVANPYNIVSAMTKMTIL